jgi:hypothetical protein
MPERHSRKGRRSQSSSSGADDYVHEEIEHVRQGKHGARSSKQAIAIGLSKARRAGKRVPPKPGTSRKSSASSGSSGNKTNRRRSRATRGALQREGSQAASHQSLSKQARQSARRRGKANLRKAARKAVRTKGAAGRRRSAQKAARTRARKAA